MPGANVLMLLGAIVLVAAGVFAFGDDSGASGELPLLAWGAMAAGAALIVTGWLRRPAVESVPTQKAAPTPDAARIDAMVRCMGFIAAADGHVDETERSIFGDIVERVTGRALGAEERRLLDLAADQDFDPAAFVRQHAGVLDDGFRRQILKAGCFIAMADGALSTGESDRLRSLATALAIPAAEYDAIVVGLRRPASPD